MLKLLCPDCGVINSCDESTIIYEFDFVYVTCYNCGGIVKIYCETAAGRKVPIELPELPLGCIVIITNKEHPWYNEIGIVRDKKVKHYRLELHNRLIWVPENWVKSHEPDDID